MSRLSLTRMRLRHLRRALGLVGAAAPAYTAVWSALLLVQGLVPASVVYVTKQVVDAAAGAIGGGLSEENVLPLLVWALVMAGLVVLQQGLQGTAAYVQAAQSEHVEDHIKALIHSKAVEVDYAFYESEDYHNKVQHANAQASARALSLLQNLGTLGRDGLAFVSIGTLLAIQYAVWLPLALAVGASPALIVLVRHNRRYTAWWRRTMSSRRWAQYLDHLIVYPDYAGEVRLFGFGRPLAAMYQEARAVLRTERLALMRRQSIAALTASVTGILTLGSVMVWIARRALQGAATLGDIASFYQALNQGQSLMRSMLSGIGQIYANALFLEDLFAYLDLQPTQQDPTDPAPTPARLEQGVRFENISFSYPGASRPALDGLDLEFPAGQVTAIVGSNGAGKSTLVKLLCRFYEPSGGRILIDGQPLLSFARADVLRMVSVLFQSPVRYQAPARENIRMADLEADEAAVLAASRAAGAHDFIERLPRGYDTRLGRMFYEGGELSGGQWQRVALARAYLRPSPIVALDEPTSAMDSWSEMDWFRRFRELVAGRTAVIITHRFTVAMQADQIHVMEAGKVIESGTHRDLIALGGRYAASWSEQNQQAEQAGRDPDDRVDDLLSETASEPLPSPFS